MPTRKMVERTATNSSTSEEMWIEIERLRKELEEVNKRLEEEIRKGLEEEGNPPEKDYGQQRLLSLHENINVFWDSRT